jgi:hypothetical protein
MRIFAILLASAAAIVVTSLSAHAERGCNRACLERRIATLEGEIAQLNANTIKAGQTVTINAPGGCLSWGGAAPGAVGWVPPPCFNSTWVIGSH